MNGGKVCRWASEAESAPGKRINGGNGRRRCRIRKAELKRQGGFGRREVEEAKLPVCSGLITVQVIKDKRRLERRIQEEEERRPGRKRR